MTCDKNIGGSQICCRLFFFFEQSVRALRGTSLSPVLGLKPQAPHVTPHCSERPTADPVPTSLRDQVPCRLCGTMWRTTSMALPEKWRKGPRMSWPACVSSVVPKPTRLGVSCTVGHRVRGRSRPHLAKPHLAKLNWPYLANLIWPNLANFC